MGNARAEKKILPLSNNRFFELLASQLNVNSKGLFILETPIKKTPFLSSAAVLLLLSQVVFEPKRFQVSCGGIEV